MSNDGDRYRLSVASTLEAVDASHWDSLVEPGNPFCTHAFLRALETSRSVGPGTGWQPAYVVAQEGDALVGALPSFIKTDSYGEFIFDWAWAEGAMRAGIDYYPKLTVSVPYTPATGARLLVHPDADFDSVASALNYGLEQLGRRIGASGRHFLFCRDREAGWLESKGYARRTTHQYHWRNDGYGSFDDFLATLRSSARKQIRKERRRVREQGIDVEVLRGRDLEPESIATLFSLYRSTSDRKWGSPYLTREFFAELTRSLSDTSLIALGKREGRIVAMTLSFFRGNHLYGRYWGAREHVDCLHFELCYYALIDWAIEHGLTLVEAGAQGEHKMKRGFVPVAIHSAHRLHHPGLHEGIRHFLDEERAAVEDALDRWAGEGPFREGAAPDLPAVAGIELPGD